MSFKIALNFAKRNIFANKQLVVPFILASSLMLMLFNIMSSLAQNEYVQTRHQSLVMVIEFGVIIIWLFAFVFVVYANRFLMKRRNKELALYGILGLEKKHISRIIFIEQVISFSIVALLSIVGGFLLGKVTFLGLNALMKDVSGRFMDYPFSVGAFVSTFIFILFLFVVVFLINVWNVKNSSPIELLSKQYKGEGEPKAKFLALGSGFLALGSGYYIALITEGTLNSLLLFFVASLLVAVGSYILFLSLSIFVLKAMKANKAIYYIDKNFLSISGMLYRMKANATGLASIAVLCTGVIITISATATIYTNIETNSKNVIPTDYAISMRDSFDIDDRNNIENSRTLLTNLVRSSESDSNKISTLYVEEYVFIPLLKNGNMLLPANNGNANIFSSNPPIYSSILTLDDYNKSADVKQVLAPDELLVSANNSRLLDIETLEVNGKVFAVKKLDNIISSSIAIDSYTIVVPSYDILRDFANYFEVWDSDSGKYYPAKVLINVFWNVEGNHDVYEAGFKSTLPTFMEENNVELGRLESTRIIKSSMYELNGGFLFLGVVIGLLFMTGTVLVTYYKQISEGYEDREKFQIMKKVGLPDSLIKKTASTQIVWMFFAPLIVSVVHSLVASKIVFQLLRLFGVIRYAEFGLNLAIVIGVFALGYLLVFNITSNVYYRLVK